MVNHHFSPPAFGEYVLLTFFPCIKQANLRFRYGKPSIFVQVPAVKLGEFWNHPGLQVLPGCQAAAILALPSLCYGRVVPPLVGLRRKVKRVVYEHFHKNSGSFQQKCRCTPKK